MTEERQTESVEEQAEGALQETDRPAPEDGAMSGPDADRLRAQAKAADDSDEVAGE